MGAREDRQPDGVGILLQHGLDDLLRRLVQAGVDDLHPGVAQRAGDDLRPAVVAVEAGLGHDDADLSGRSGHGADDTRTSSFLRAACPGDAGSGSLQRFPMARPHAHPQAADLLRTEHAVARVLACASGEADAYPGLLAAIGESLDCAGALWLPDADGELHCAETWPAGTAVGAALVAEAPVAQRGAFAFPLPGVGVMAFATAAPLEPDDSLLASMESLGSQISQFVLRCRAQNEVRASEARKSAILDAAFDCIITMDHEGNVVEVNRATERTFGYRATDMIGRELAELIVPPSLREAHRRGVEHYLQSGSTKISYHPLRLAGMRADGSEFPVEVVIARADLP